MSSAITIAAVVAVGSAVQGQKEARKGKKAQKKANKLQQKINKLKNQQAMRDYLRNFRQAQSNAIINAVAAGVGLDSSAVRGTLQSQISQVGVATQESAQMTKWGETISDLNLQAGSQFAKSQQWNQLSSFAASFISYGGGA